MIGEKTRRRIENRYPLLSIENARIDYRSDEGVNTAVGDVSFDVYPGEKVMLLGPSGCGKSTLLKAVAGFIELSDGSITFAEMKSPEPGPDRAVVFQEFDQLFPWRTVLDNVAYPLRVTGRDKQEARDKAEHYVEMTGLTQAKNRFPHQLSGGMKQRVAIARALALDPLMLLMDEPFGSLDALTRNRLQRELNDIARRTGVTILFVTHSIQEALVLGDRVVVLSGSPSSVKEIADVSNIDDFDSERLIWTRRQLRKLLTSGEDGPEDWEELNDDDFE